MPPGITYVSGENPELNAEIDRLISEQKRVHAQQSTRSCTAPYVAEHDIDNIDQVRTGLNKILTEVGSSLTEAGNDARQFEGALGGLVTRRRQQRRSG